MTHLPKFSPALLHPRYWLLWLGIGLLWLVVQLPYPLIYRLGNAIGRLAMRFMKRRAKIAYRNLELCFPEKSEQEHHRMVVMNFESVGMGLMETGMAWFWPVRRIARWTDTIGFEHIRDVQAQQRGILLIGIHFLTLEMGARMFGMNEPGIGVYRPNDNPVIDWLQTWGRLRSNKDMIDRKDLKGMIRALKKGESGVVRTGSRLRPDRQRLCPTVCGRPGGDHLRHLDAGEKCPKPASCPSSRAANRTVKVMN
ncbi:Lipid A biosynthesis (KDO) 2-(lauroyl)-lipid IVA acyltransferase [Klebsiella pneumoniae ISC21]|nr:Lipid A biosynthesis (KDO) 2-(lauroyl)-lipid IVA acyltransferase [Klebsiella pneumoniae ISC21]